jgi:methionyl-tRNA formyltransferase
LIIVAAYGKILPEKFLNIPGFGCVNVHTSLLPKLRGPSPIQNALLLGEKKTGATIMLMDKGMDTGDILTRFEVKIDPDDTTPTLTEKLGRFGAELLIKTIPLWINKQIKPEKQNESHATLCQLIEKEDGKIIWNKSAQTTYNQFRAFYPWPGIFCFWKDDTSIRRIKLTEISIDKDLTSDSRHLGEVFEQNNQLCIQTSSGSIIIQKIQMEGKKEMNADQFKNGHPTFVGSILK